MRVACLINSGSGGQRGAWVASRLRERCSESLKAGSLKIIDLEWGDAEGCLREADGSDRVLIAGGDGTVSLLLPHLLRESFEVGLLPLGTGNDLARELRIDPQEVSRHPESVVRSFQGEVASVSLTVWSVRTANQERLFINYLSLGFDAEVVHRFSSIRERLPWIGSVFGVIGNRTLYGLSGLFSLFRPPLSQVDLQGVRPNQSLFSFQAKRARALFFSNIQPVMGFGRSHPKSSPEDEVLELSILRNAPSYFGFSYPKFSPWKPEYSERGVKWQLSNIPPGSYLQVDGDSLGVLLGDTIQIERAGKIQFCTPKKGRDDI